MSHRAPFRFPKDDIPEHFRRSAVLISFWAEEDELRVLLTRRAATLSRDAGVVCFPGGLLEEGEDFADAALREAEEEVGLAPEQVELLGCLDDAWSGGGSLLVPHVAWLTRPPELRASRDEVAELLLPRVSELLEPRIWSAETVVHRGVEYTNQVVCFDGGRAFGLTADLLIEALEWGLGASPSRGPERLEELRSFFAEPEAGTD